MGSNGDKRESWVRSTSKANVPPKFERNDKHEVSDIDQRKTHSVSITETDLADDLWWRNNDVPSSSSEQWKEKECLVKIVFPFPKMDVPAYDNYEDAISISEKKEGKRKTEAAGIKAAIKEKVYEENLDVRSGPVKIEWFKGGITNNCYNCLDRNIAAGNGSKVALYWEGNDPGFDGSLTYNQLLEKVCQLANYLKDIGVKKGDAVVIYLPMLMELPISMLACSDWCCSLGCLCQIFRRVACPKNCRL